MLVSAFFPFTDLRPLTVPGYRALDRPAWPVPTAEVDYVRGVGCIGRRTKPGFDGWVGEDRFAVRVNALTLRLPRAIDVGGAERRLRLVRKACFFDGVVNGRFEVLVQVADDPERDAPPATFADAQEIVSALMRVRAVCRPSGFDGPLGRAGPALREVWAAATVRVGAPTHAAEVSDRRPHYVVEADHPLDGLEAPAEPGPAMPYRIDLRLRDRAEVITLCPEDGPAAPVAARQGSRLVRTYLLRLKQDVEALHLILRSDKATLDGDAVQAVFRDYMGRIRRARTHVAGQLRSEAVDAAYALFERLNPGSVAAIRSRLLGSPMRRQIKRNLGELLDETELAASATVGVFKLERVMGDKFEIEGGISGQGVVLGRGGRATVTGSTNAQAAQLRAELLDFAERVRAEGANPDAAAQAVVVEAAAEKAGAGDEEGARTLLQAAAGWVRDLAVAAAPMLVKALVKTLT